MENKVYSFDIYDTCITRVFARPTDLFFGLAQALNNKGFRVSHEIEAEIVNLRIDAAINCRKTLKKREDIAIRDIYQGMKFAK